MAAKSAYLRQALANAALRGIAFTPPVSVYLALYHDDPTPNNIGTEASFSGYARKLILFTPVTPQGATENSGHHTWTPTANAAPLTHFGILDAVASGNLLYFGPLLAPRSVLAGRPLKLVPGRLDVLEE